MSLPKTLKISRKASSPIKDPIKDSVKKHICSNNCNCDNKIDVLRFRCRAQYYYLQCPNVCVDIEKKLCSNHIDKEVQYVKDYELLYIEYVYSSDPLDWTYSSMSPRNKTDSQSGGNDVEGCPAELHGTRCNKKIKENGYCGYHRKYAKA